MARGKERLTALEIKRKKVPGLFGDGGGLYLSVQPGGTKSWAFRYMLKGKAREMGLGPYPERSLEEARGLAHGARKLLIDSVDPLERRDELRVQVALDAAKAISFQQCAEQYVAAHKAGWRNKKHAAQWDATLQTYAFPEIGGLPVAAIDTGLVMKILEPLWATKPETASRVRGRIEAVLSWASVRGYRSGQNPARWRGHLDQLLPRRSKVRKVKHHAALPWKEIGRFMGELKGQDGIAARALQLAILTAARTGEVIGATWKEINLNERLWVIPEARMKGGHEHRVALSAAAVAVLEGMLKLAGNGDPDAYVFPGARKNKPLSNMAMLVLLRRMGRDNVTTHGFRSTFRVWCAETGQPADIAEAALAHTVGDKTIEAYQRGDLLERRRVLADDWARFCSMNEPVARVA